MDVQFARPFLTGKEGSAVSEVIASGWVSQGPRVREFEQAFAERVGAPDAVATTSCTTALHLALYASGVGPGDEVIVPSLSFVATANSVWQCGATPVFADIDPLTYNLDPAAAERAITPRTRAIMPVHQVGLPADMDAFLELSERYRVTILEDAACAIGSLYKGCPIGSLGPLSCFSLHPRKVITTGEGGMITTDDPDVERELRSIVNQGRSDNGDWLVHQRLGFNFRMDEMSAAVGLAQLEKLEFLLAERARVAARYQRGLAGVDGLQLPFEGRHPRSWFIYYVRLAEGIDRQAVIDGMAARGISTRPYLPAIHLQPEYRKLGMHEGMLPITERVSRATLALPFFIQLEDQDIDYVCTSLREVVETQA
jgi:perosamine synthetase